MLLSITAASLKGISRTKIAIIVNRHPPSVSLPTQDIRTFYLTASPKQWPLTYEAVETVCGKKACIENKLFCARVLNLQAEDAEKIVSIGYMTPAPGKFSVLPQIKILYNMYQRLLEH
jgi:hypothetical protein